MAPSVVPASFRLGYRPALDGLRAVAVLAVMGVHFNVPHAGAGFLGVDVFFVLSGFLITSLLLEEWQDTGRVSLPRFYLRRALRLFPALWLLLLVISPFEPFAHILVTLAYYANWAIAFGWLPMGGDHLIGHVWSLSIEEQFYLLWPSILVLLLRWRPSRRVLLAIPLTLALACNVLRLALWSAAGSGHPSAGTLWVRLYAGSDTHCDGLLLGCALALAIGLRVLPDWQSVQRPVRLATGLVPVIAIAAILVGQNWPVYFQGGYLVVALAVALVISRLTIYPSAIALRVLGCAPLVAIGKISYGLYLWHFPIHQFILMKVHPYLPPLYRIPLEFALTFLIAGLSFRYLERPALRLKERLAAHPPAASGSTTAFRSP